MTHHLADYFRYTTDVENQCPTLKEEIELIQHYLEIYKMRLERIEFEIDIPNDMLDEEFLRLTLQPIVENAIIHGIEPKVGKGFIRIKGFRKGSTNMLVVDDNGGGVIDEKLEHLQKNIDKPQSKEIRVGIHNVHQRLKYHFGEGSGVFFSHSKHGGLRVELRWNRKTEQ
jgi:two-component system sensor histidine kinase YesM